MSWLREHRHTALLAAIIGTVAVRPLFGAAGPTSTIFGVAVAILMLVALYTARIDELIGARQTLVAQRRTLRIVGWGLASLAVVSRVVADMFPTTRVYGWCAVAWLVYFAFITWSELASVLRQRQITTETISMSISVYLLLGVTWSMLYIVILEFEPGAFDFGPGTASAQDPAAYFPLIFYFSLTCLSTIGFGDITPLALQARYAAVAEGITGQLYLAILVARLVGLRMSSATRGRR